MAGAPKRRADKALLDSLTTGDYDSILDRVAEAESLSSISQSFHVSRRALTEWLEDDEERSARYKRARIQAAGMLAETGLERVDEATPESVAVVKLQVQHRQWLASRWDRATYGEQKGAEVVVNLNMLHLDALRRQSTPQVATSAKCIDGSVTIDSNQNSK